MILRFSLGSITNVCHQETQAMDSPKPEAQEEGPLMGRYGLESAISDLGRKTVEQKGADGVPLTAATRISAMRAFRQLALGDPYAFELDPRFSSSRKA
jgi:hypothetical protein